MSSPSLDCLCVSAAVQPNVLPKLIPEVPEIFRRECCRDLTTLFTAPQLVAELCGVGRDMAGATQVVGAAGTGTLDLENMQVRSATEQFEPGSQSLAATAIPKDIGAPH